MPTYTRPTASAPPPMPPLLMPQPPIAPLLPPAHVVDLMTAGGSAAFGARWKVLEAKLIECPALSDAMPEYRTTYDIDPHAELPGFDDSGMARGRRDRPGRQAGRRHGVVLLVPHDPDDSRTPWVSPRTVRKRSSR